MVGAWISAPSKEVEIAGLIQHEENTALEGPNTGYPTLTGK